MTFDTVFIRSAMMLDVFGRREIMATAEQLEQAIRDVDAHHARVIHEVENRLLG
jgi:hypothetical protein